MTETTTQGQPALDDAGALELVRVPAWEAKYKRSENPEELAHMVCCRDLDWRTAMCGYVEEAQTIMEQAINVCTMCVEASGGPEGPMATRDCPVDNRPCPPDDEVDRMIAERTSRG